MAPPSRTNTVYAPIASTTDEHWTAIVGRKWRKLGDLDFAQKVEQYGQDIQEIENQSITFASLATKTLKRKASIEISEERSTKRATHKEIGVSYDRQPEDSDAVTHCYEEDEGSLYEGEGDRDPEDNHSDGEEGSGGAEQFEREEGQNRVKPKHPLHHGILLRPSEGKYQGSQAGLPGIVSSYPRNIPSLTVAPGECFVHTHHFNKLTPLDTCWEPPSSPGRQDSEIRDDHSAPHPTAAMPPVKEVATCTPAPTQPNEGVPLNDTAELAPEETAQGPPSPESPTPDVQATPPTAEKPRRTRAVWKRSWDPIGPRTCKWDGCRVRLAEGRDMWAHMVEYHNSGKGGAGKTPSTIPNAGPSHSSVTVKGEDEDAVAEVGQLAGDDSPENVEKERDVSPAAPASTSKQKQKSPGVGKVPCRWKGCSSEVRPAELRRHIESKHIPLRGASCPKGCGHWTNRSDMLKRHVDKCRYVQKEYRGGNDEDMKSAEE